VRRTRAICGLLALALEWLSCARTGLGQEQQQPVQRQVLAFYYGWYRNPKISGRWDHWSNVDESAGRIGNSTHYPALGPYDSHNLDVLKQQCEWAKQAGLTGFIVSWWGPKDFTNEGIMPLLNLAQQANLHVTVYFETCHPEQTPVRETALRDVLYLLSHYGNHPAWLKVNGKPVLFVYSRAIAEIGLDDWKWVISEVNRRSPGGVVVIGDQLTKEAAEAFDGIHTYNITDKLAGKSVAEVDAWAAKAFPKWVQRAGSNRVSCVTIIPGYDDSKLGRSGTRPITSRHDGATYRQLWQQAIAANPDWVLVTSWNEWHEGSEIEPSVENGDRELKTSAEFAPKFLALKPRMVNP
jgi:glycoprotein endo-alpha-1,2-mannosidase